MDLVGVLGGTGFNEVILQIGVAGAVVDTLQGSLVQGHVIELAVLEELEGHGSGLNHLDGDGVKALAVGIVPVVGALGQNLLVLGNEIGNGVSAAVPHVLPGHVTVAVNTQLLDQFCGQGVEAVVGGNRGEVGKLVNQLVGDGAGSVVSGNANHLGKLGASVSSQSLGSLSAVGLGQSLGVLIVIIGAGNHFSRHGHVVGVVLGVVQHPLQAGGPVGSQNVSLDFAVLVEPGHTVVQREDPGLAAVGGLIALRSVRLQVAVVVVGQKAVDQVTQHVQVIRSLGIMDIPGLQLTGLGLVGVQILEAGSGLGFRSLGSFLGVVVGFGFVVVFAGFRLDLGLARIGRGLGVVVLFGVTACEQGKDHQNCQKHCESLFHVISSCFIFPTIYRVLSSRFGTTGFFLPVDFVISTKTRRINTIGIISLDYRQVKTITLKRFFKF